MTKILYLEGSVHGRFQPLHNGHIEYINCAFNYCNHLWIGITQINCFSLNECPKDIHRQKRVNNPLTYFERYKIIMESMIELGYDKSTFDIIPFPIDVHQTLNQFLPTDIPIFTTVYDEWNKYKIKVLESLGYVVNVLYVRKEKEFEGIKIRNLIIDGNPRWKDYVPKSTIALIEKENISQKLRTFSKLDKQSI